MSTTKSVISALPLREEIMRPGFSAVGMRHPSLNPFMDVTLFSMSQPTFPPHPHAGFSAVTYMLPESESGFINRDSLGDKSRIGPGAIHWTQAGAGMMHEEVPEQPGVACRGFQMFVKLATAQELLPPAAFHADPVSIPVVRGEGWSARVLAGSFNSVESPLQQLAHDVVLYDLTIEPGAQVDIMLDEGVAVWAMLMEGNINVAQAHYAAPAGIFWGIDNEMVLIQGGAKRSRILVGGGKPLRESFQSSGPFALSTNERLSDARKRFSSGAMGGLAPSF
jgi:redox-sensitive bicupin YhaK (pirin superfamily)